VLDTSAVLELVLNLPLSARVASRIVDPDVSIHAPHLLTVEALAVLRRRIMAGLTTQDEAHAALAAVSDLGISYHEHLLLGRRILALRDNLTASDAAFVALAELLEAPLVTSDARLASAPGHRAVVDLIEP
jgi:predicted nucleic acid-binding protein